MWSRFLVIRVCSIIRTFNSSGQRAETWIKAAGISSGAVVFGFCIGPPFAGTLPSQNSLGIFQCNAQIVARFPMPSAPRHPRRAAKQTSARMIKHAWSQ